MSVQQVRSALHRLTAAANKRLAGSPLAIMLDIDGTLSPIAPKPEEAIVPATTRDTLRRLAKLPNVAVALVSGRSAEDAWRLAGVEGAWVVGNHGFELRTPDGQLSASEEVRQHEGAVAEASRLLAPMERTVPGVLVEDKRWTLSVHYRLVEANSVPAVLKRAEDVAHSLGLHVTEGKKIAELRPPVRVDKGTATMALAERLGALGKRASVIYAGDDRTDEDAFRALRASHPRAVTVRIVAGDETSSQTEAEFVLESPDELRLLLEWILARRARAETP